MRRILVLLILTALTLTACSDKPLEAAAVTPEPPTPAETNEPESEAADTPADFMLLVNHPDGHPVRSVCADFTARVLERTGYYIELIDYGDSEFISMSVSDLEAIDSRIGAVSDASGATDDYLDLLYNSGLLGLCWILEDESIEMLVISAGVWESLSIEEQAVVKQCALEAAFYSGNN